MRLLIRADGDGVIGTGHVMRTLALAERVLADGGDTILLAARLDDRLCGRVAAAGVRVSHVAAVPGTDDDAKRVIAESAAWSADWVVLDGLAFTGPLQQRLHDAGLKVLLIDDYGRGDRYCADVILNQNAFAVPAMYAGRAVLARGGPTELLLGPRYCLLRREFLRTTMKTIHARADRILVTLGGADPENVTASVIEALRPLCVEPDGQNVHLKVVVGTSNRHRASIESLADPRVEVLAAADDMPALMDWADIAIAGAGVTVYELLRMGVPTGFIAIVASQQDSADALARTAGCVRLPRPDQSGGGALRREVNEIRRDAARRATMSRAGSALVDGGGVDRVLKVMAAHD